MIVKPDTVVRWQRTGFRLYWSWLSRRGRRRPAARPSWRTFLRNHREVIAAMDLFVVFTVRFQLLYVLFVVHHDRRQILHTNVTERPTAAWVVQQLRESFPYDHAPRHLIFDRDSIFSSSSVTVGTTRTTLEIDLLLTGAARTGSTVECRGPPPQSSDAAAPRRRWGRATDRALTPSDGILATDSCRRSEPVRASITNTSAAASPPS